MTCCKLGWPDLFAVLDFHASEISMIGLTSDLRSGPPGQARGDEKRGDGRHPLPSASLFVGALRRRAQRVRAAWLSSHSLGRPVGLCGAAAPVHRHARRWWLRESFGFAPSGAGRSGGPAPLGFSLAFARAAGRPCGAARRLVPHALLVPYHFPTPPPCAISPPRHDQAPFPPSSLPLCRPAPSRATTAKIPRQATSAVAYELVPPAPDDPLLDFMPVPHVQPAQQLDHARCAARLLSRSSPRTGIVTDAARHSRQKHGGALQAAPESRGPKGFRGGPWDAAIDRGVARLEDSALRPRNPGRGAADPPRRRGRSRRSGGINEALVMFFLRNRLPAPL